MSQSFAPFYDVNRTYEDNYLQGPFGAFAEVMKGDSAAGASAQSAQTTQSQSSDQAEEFLGFRVNLPFGIPAGPLLNERFTTAAFRMGFDLAVYKTVRSRAWGCNAFPNVLAEGKTELSGAAIEPEIMDLVSVLQKMGAIISVDVDRTFRIEGVKELKGYTHTSLTDRIEAASWASAALATHGDIFVKGATQPEMMTFLNVFRKIGGEFDITDKGIRFWHPGGDLKPVAIETDVHPGFMTDWQQPLVVALTQANGLSIVHETVYENRFGFTKPLVQMGATIQLYRECLGSLPCRFQQRNYKHSAVIFGPTPLTGRDIDVPDLRGGFSHLIAALAAKGPSNVQGISLIDRGYADFRGKLEALGADFD